jgi:hypothetical protein
MGLQTVYEDGGKTSVTFVYENNQQDALYRLIYYSKSAVHVSGDVFAHHLEHLVVFTVSGSVHPSCCRLVSWMSWNCVPTHPTHYLLVYISYGRQLHLHIGFPV